MSSPAEPFLIPSELKPTFRNNHLQYAITWFVMSFAFFVLFLVYLKKNK
jgi:cytochrome oxidase assembly protein ShyY1